MSRSTVPSKRPADAQEAAWVAGEDRFVLQQAKKRAAIRAKSGRAKPIDWLTVILAVIDPERNPLDDELEDGELDIISPEAVFEGLEDAQLSELEKGIETYQTLEASKSNRDYWTMMKAICRDRRKTPDLSKASARGVSSVASDLDKLFGSKNLEELEKLEKQIETKLASNEPIDADYWEHLLKSLLTYKARAKLRKISAAILDSRLDRLRKQQIAEAEALKSRLSARLAITSTQAENGNGTRQPRDSERHYLDPEPLLRLQTEDKNLESFTPAEFAKKINNDRQQALKFGYVPSLKRHGDSSGEPASKRIRTSADEAAQNVSAAFDREVARGMGDNEEIFTAEEEVITKNKHLWADKYRPRKPQYFNRAALGYEWNKYNQTHYDHENPPPKVVQGYKFTIFYPDLVDKIKAPTYRIERENGRRRGETFAPAGEDDTCLIRFIAGAPYEDIAFRIVDKEWDYSAKRERGFKSSFDKGILQLQFQFKKVYYRK